MIEIQPPFPAAWDRFLAEGLLGTELLLRNAEVSISSVEMAGHSVPLITNRLGASDCSWVSSLRNSYGPYGRAETDIVHMNRGLRPVYLAGSRVAEALLAAGGLSGGNYLNNWLLATNLYGPEFTLETIAGTVAKLTVREPDLPVVIRSLTPALHSGLLAELISAGFLLLPSRQVWIVKDPASGAWRRHRDARRDLQQDAATGSQCEWISADAFSDKDYSRAVELYQQLYRVKYPRFNPDYTERFFRIAVGTGFLNLHGLRREGEPELSGIVGLVHRGNSSCTPVLGYDTGAPLSMGLYRRLMLRAFLACELRGSLLHCSSGAGRFKYNRGAVSAVEFAAVWANHLPIYRRAGLRILSAALTRWIVPYLESHQL